MLVCSHCTSSHIEHDSATGQTICQACNYVLEENAIVSEVTFSETASGASVLQGQFISASSGTKPLATGPGFSGLSRESREITLRNGRMRIATLAAALRLNSYIVEAAQRLFQAAMQHNFIQGRKTQNVVAACLYIICRREQTPHMLIDFSDMIQTNVFVLGDTYTKFINLLHLKMPIVDPSLYIERFASRLEFGDKSRLVAVTALRLVGRMKRDWMQVGRRPSGLCGASLLIAARLHGFKRTHKEIIEVVRVCELTLRNRLSEFEQTPAGQLTPQEFETIDLEEEADPPSFSQARKRQKLSLVDKPRQEKEAASSSSSSSSAAAGAAVSVTTGDVGVAEDLSGVPVSTVEETEREMEADLLKMEKEELQRIQAVIEEERTRKSGAGGSSSSASAGRSKATDGPAEGETDVEVEEESLSDLDEDLEVVGAILTPDEVEVKTLLWMEANEEYLKQQQEKQRLLAENGGLEKLEARKKKRKLRAEMKGLPPAQTAAEATFQALQQKKLSKKINYAVLENLFSSSEKNPEPAQ